MLPKDSHGTAALLAQGAIEAAIGPPDPTPPSTKKILKWSDCCGLTVNLARESQRSATVWIAGDPIAFAGRFDLDSQLLIPQVPPRNSNLSTIVQLGPTIFTYMNLASDSERLTKLIVQLKSGEVHVDLASVVDDPFEATERGDDEDGLELPSNQRRVLTEARDESIEQLVGRIRKGRLELQPEFQRGFVWSSAKASALIESILMKIPLPVIYVAQLENGVWEVVDGQQRLTAIQSYVEGRFPDGKQFRLGHLSVMNHLRGKTFKDLPSADQASIEDYLLRVIMIQKEASADLKYEVFERLNSGAEKLNDMELRNCIYRGPYNDMLQDLTHNDTLLRIRGEKTPDARMKDRQLILRFFAMWRKTHLRFRSPMKQFMNHEMQENRFASVEQVSEMKAVFANAIQCSWDVFGCRAFRRYSPGDDKNPDGQWDSGDKINIALWDTIMYVFTHFERRQVLAAADAVREEFLDVLSHDDRFVDYIGRSTDKVDRLRYRAETWLARVRALICTPPNEVRNFTNSLKAALYDSDRTCAICGQEILTLFDAEVDHIQHYWRGGRTIPENARLTHRYCNRRRGGRM